MRVSSRDAAIPLSTLLWGYGDGPDYRLISTTLKSPMSLTPTPQVSMEYLHDRMTLKPETVMNSLRRRQGCTEFHNNGLAKFPEVRSLFHYHNHKKHMFQFLFL